LGDDREILLVQNPSEMKGVFEKLANKVYEKNKSLENQILQGLSPESSFEMEVTFEAGRFPLLSNEEARSKILETGKLEGFAVEKLELNSLNISHPILVRSCKIGLWSSAGAIFESKIEIRETTIQEMQFSSLENPSQVKKDMTIAYSRFQGDGKFSGLICQGSVRMIHTEFQRGTFWLDRAMIHGNLECSDVSFSKGDFQKMTLEGQMRMDPVSFAKGVNFQKARFQGGSVFTGSTFEGVARFRGCHFLEYCDFSGTDFQDEAYFGEAHFHGAEFFKVCFGGPANFVRATFREFGRFRQGRFEADSVWTGVRVSGILFFEDIELMDTVNFQEGIFQKLEFQLVRFRSQVDFSSSIFEGPLSFHETQVEGNILFHYCQFQSRADFKGASFHKGISFIGTEGNLFSLKRSQVEGHILAEIAHKWKEASWEYKRLKKIFEDLQEPEDAEWAHYHWKVAQRKAKMQNPYRPDLWIRAFFEWIFLDLGTGYGTKPGSILWLALGLILAFTFLYAYGCPKDFFNPSFPQEQMTINTALVLSFSTFSTSGTLGWTLRPSSLGAYLVITESLLGFFILLLFTVTFVRKMMH
ncbi:MAG: hypothetical protein D6785_11985, partial [Planctomycetota bacterium]